MATGMITLRDDNVPVTCGFNVQFTMGLFEIVGHVESFDISFVVHPNGQYETTATVQLSRIVHDFEGQLEFIPPDSMANLLTDTPAKIDDAAGFGSALSSLSGGLAGQILGAAGGILS
jgi:hypothetical protein